MPTQYQVFAAADEIRARNERVSLRSIRAVLPRGGSYRDIGEHLSAWKSERNYQPRIELAQLPEFLQTSLAGVGKTLWESAMQEATRQLNSDRERANELVRSERQLRDEALAMVDVLEARVVTLQAEIRSLQLQARLDLVEAQPPGAEPARSQARP